MLLTEMYEANKLDEMGGQNLAFGGHSLSMGGSYKPRAPKKVVARKRIIKRDKRGISKSGYKHGTYRTGYKNGPRAISFRAKRRKSMQRLSYLARKARKGE